MKKWKVSFAQSALVTLRSPVSSLGRVLVAVKGGSIKIKKDEEWCR